MRYLARFLKFSLKWGLVVAGIAVIVSYARLSEHGDLRRDLMDRLAKAYDGRLSIGGAAELELSFPPRVVIEDVRIKNSPWGTRPDMLTADRVIAEVDLIPLIQGDMAVPRLRMIGVDIVVETKRDGTTNWDELNDFETAAGPANPATLPVVLPGVAGASVVVAGATLTIIGPAAQTVAAVSLGAAQVGGLIPCP